MTPYRPTDEIVEAFTAGDCWRLAYTLSRMTGAPMVFANPLADVDTDHWEHVGVLIDEQVLDIEGLHDFDEWEEQWAYGGHAYVTADAKRILHLIRDQEPMYYWTRPWRPARRLLETYAQHLTLVNG